MAEFNVRLQTYQIDPDERTRRLAAAYRIILEWGIPEEKGNADPVSLHSEEATGADTETPTNTDITPSTFPAPQQAIDKKNDRG